MKVSITPATTGTVQLMGLALTKDEGATLYFALRAQRDQLVDSLIKEARTQFDDDDYRYTKPHSQEPTRTDVLDLNDNIALGWEKGDTNYEDLMFLHEQLYKVNKMLFDLIQDNTLDIATWLDVD